MSKISCQKRKKNDTYLHSLPLSHKTFPAHLFFLNLFSFRSTFIKMSDSESDTEITIANDLVVTKYKMAGEIANR